MFIQNKELEKPLIQGGMGVGVSLGNLAGSVAACGAMGVISTANIGFMEEDFYKNPIEASKRAMKEEVIKAKKLSKGKGLIGINAMVATVLYEEMIEASIEAGIDCIISGAGLPLKLPAIVGESTVLLAPIVSSGKATTLINRYWDKNYKRVADFIVIEGAKAGGHLGFSNEELFSNTNKTVEELLIEVKEAIKPYEEKYGKYIPVFVAGGLTTRDKIEDIMTKGADGVQVGARFIATEECDATLEYKNVYVNATDEDVILLSSPVGMPARAIKTPFIERLSVEGRIKPTRCVNCIHTCDPAVTKYCITKALIEAQQGNYNEGLFFCDTNPSSIGGIVSVEELITELM